MDDSQASGLLHLGDGGATGHWRLEPWKRGGKREGKLTAVLESLIYQDEETEALRAEPQCNISAEVTICFSSRVSCPRGRGAHSIQSWARAQQPPP